jgi:hypothetical protein
MKRELSLWFRLGEERAGLFAELGLRFRELNGSEALFLSRESEVGCSELTRPFVKNVTADLTYSCVSR